MPAWAGWSRVPGRDVVLLAHPEEIHAVLASKAHYFRIFGQDMLRRITPWGLVATEGQVHDDNRARMMLAMRKVLARRVPEAAAHTCQERLATLRDGDTLDVGSLAREVTLGVAASILSPPSDEARATHPDEGEFAARLSRSSAWLLGLPIPAQWGAFALDARGTLRALRLHRRFRRQIVEAIRRVVARPNVEAPGDMLSLLIQGSETGGTMPEEFLADNILNLLLAAYETSGNALAWALWEASGDPTLQARIAAEGRTMPDDPNSHESWMNEAHWTDATLRETLRLYPSVWTLCRQALADYRVGDVIFPRGTVFMTSQWVTQRDPRWFVDALRFAPERWEDERVSVAAGEPGVTKRPQFAYFPFGAGNRFCIGKATFEFEGSMLLGAFFRDWSAGPVAGCRPRPKFFATMRPDSPLTVRVRRR